MSESLERMTARQIVALLGVCQDLNCYTHKSVHAPVAAAISDARETLREWIDQHDRSQDD